MAFRKTAYSRVFVDESIPSFLAQRNKKIITHAPPQALARAPEKPKEVAVEEHPHAAVIADRRNQPMQLRPLFMLKTILIALSLNAALYIGFYALSTLPKSDQPQVNLTILATQSEPSRAAKESQLDERVVTYTRSAPSSGGEQ